MGITSDPIQDRMGSWPRNVTASRPRAYLIVWNKLQQDQTEAGQPGLALGRGIGFSRAVRRKPIILGFSR